MFYADLTLLHSQWLKLYGALAVLNAVGPTDIFPNNRGILFK